MMTGRKILLMMTACMMTACMMTACSNEDNVGVTPETETGVIIPYTVTVGNGAAATTRATVDDDYQTLYFAEGDKLYISGTDIKGVLDIQEGAGTTVATFSGDLIYSGEGSPADDLKLTATLVSAQQKVGRQVTVKRNGTVTVNYKKSFCKSVYEAVQQYSLLWGTSTYSATSFTLNQQTVFLNFEVTFLDGTAAGTNLSAKVIFNHKDNPKDTYHGNVTTTTVNGKVVAQFVLPVATGTPINVLTLMISSATFNIRVSQMLTNSVYNVRKEIIAPALELTNPAVGQVICKNGMNYTSLPHNMKALAMICYVKDNHGLALALTDEEGSQNWDTAKSTAAAHPLEFSSGETWKLPSKDEWDLMINAAGGFTKLCNGFESIGGTNLQDMPYWSSTAVDDNNAYSIDSQGWSEKAKKGTALVRACLAF